MHLPAFHFHVICTPLMRAFTCSKRLLISDSVIEEYNLWTFVWTFMIRKRTNEETKERKIERTFRIKECSRFTNIRDWRMFVVHVHKQLSIHETRGKVNQILVDSQHWTSCVVICPTDTFSISAIVVNQAACILLSQRVWRWGRKSKGGEEREKKKIWGKENFWH